MAQPLPRRGDRTFGWTFDDVADLEDDRRHEVVDGVLLTMSPPTTRHDQITRRMQRQLEPQLPTGWDIIMNTGLRIGTDGRSPDLATYDGVVELTDPFPLRLDLRALD